MLNFPELAAVWYGGTTAKVKNSTEALVMETKKKSTNGKEEKASPLYEGKEY